MIADLNIGTSEGLLAWRGILVFTGNRHRLHTVPHSFLCCFTDHP